MTIENQDIEQNSDVEDIIQEDVRPDEVENDDDEAEITEITFDGEPLDDGSDDDAELEEESFDDLNSIPDADVESSVVSTLRKNSRQKDKYIKRLKFQLEQTKKPTPNSTQVLQEPVLPKISDYDYDDDDFNTAIKKYSDDLLQYKIEQRQKNERITNLQKIYIEQKSKLNMPNFDKYESVVTNNLDLPKQNLILRTENPALIVLALAKNTELLNELSGLNNEDFAYKIAKIEQKIEVNTVKKPKPKTKPETKTMIKGSSTSMSINDKATEEKLLEKARKTKNYTEYYAFKKGKK